MSTKCKYSVRDLVTGEWRPANRKGDWSNTSHRCSNTRESWYVAEKGKAKGEQKGKAIGMAIGKARHVALEALGEDGIAEVKEKATILASSIIDSNKKMYKAGSDEYAYRICNVMKTETVKDDGSTVTTVNWDEDMSAFTRPQRNPPFCRSDGELHTTAECREFIQVETLYEGPSCGSDGTTSEMLQHQAYLAHGIEQQLLEIVHNNPNIQVPDSGSYNSGDFRFNKNKNIHILTRAVVHGNPKVPTEHGERSATLLVKVPRCHMHFNFNDAAIQSLKRGREQSREGSARHRVKKRRLSESSSSG